MVVLGVGVFLMSEVLLHIRNAPLLGPCSRTMPRVLEGNPRGSAFSEGRGTPVCSRWGASRERFHSVLLSISSRTQGGTGALMFVQGVSFICCVQGYLAQEKTPTSLGPP